MRALPAALALAACSLPAGGGHGGIVSTNPCADALLVRLVEPGRIAAISRYSQDAGATSMPLAVARRFRATAGTAEEVIALRPDLVLASTFTPPATREAYARVGLRVLFLDSPTTVAASVAQVRQVAAAVGERARGEVLVSGIASAFLSSVRPEPVEGRPAFRSVGRTSTGSGRTEEGAAQPSGKPSALLYLTGDLANGSGTLLDELTRRAGFRNAAAEYGLTYTGRVPLERLLAHPPDVVIAPDGRGRADALRRRLLPGVRRASFPRELVNCGGPAIVPALARLRRIRATLP